MYHGSIHDISDALRAHADRLERAAMSDLTRALRTPSPFTATAFPHGMGGATTAAAQSGKSAAHTQSLRTVCDAERAGWPVGELLDMAPTHPLDGLNAAIADGPHVVDPERGILTGSVWHNGRSVFVYLTPSTATERDPMVNGWLGDDHVAECRLSTMGYCGELGGKIASHVRAYLRRTAAAMEDPHAVAYARAVMGAAIPAPVAAAYEQGAAAAPITGNFRTGVRGLDAQAYPDGTALGAGLPDTGARTAFASGAVRDAMHGKGDPHAIPPCFIRAVAKRFEDGRKKYGNGNWLKGIPLSRYQDAVIRHVLAWAEGQTDEDHAGAVGWNVAAWMHTEQLIRSGALPQELDDLPYRWRASDLTGAVGVDLLPDPEQPPAMYDTSTTGPVVDMQQPAFRGILFGAGKGPEEGVFATGGGVGEEGQEGSTVGVLATAGSVGRPVGGGGTVPSNV